MEWDQLVEMAKKSYGLKELRIEECPLGNLGECKPDEGIVILNFHLNDRMRIMVLFHELGHIHCYNNDIWYEFHHTTDFKCFRTEDIDPYITMAQTAEQWVDDWAAAELKKYFPDLRYEGNYSKPQSRQWHREVMTRLILQEIAKPAMEEIMEY